MGIRLHPSLNYLECSIDNGELNVYFFDDVIKKINIGIPKSISMPRQVNFVKTLRNNVAAYLSNDEFITIVRFDGTVDVMTKRYVLVFTTYIDSKLLNDTKFVECYAGSIEIMGHMYPATLVELSNGNTFIFSESCSMTFLLDRRDPVSDDVRVWARTHNDVGTMILTDLRTYGSVLFVDFGDGKSYRLRNFKTLQSDGFIGGLV